MFLELDISQILDDNKIVVGKFPGSTTEINQPADQNPFKACKKAFRASMTLTCKMKII